MRPRPCRGSARGKLRTLMSVPKRFVEQRGGWRRNGRKVEHRSRETWRRPGFRRSVVVKSSTKNRDASRSQSAHMSFEAANHRGAKGRRKMDVRGLDAMEHT